MEGDVDTVKLNSSPPPVAEQSSKQAETAKNNTQIQETSQKRSTAGLFITPVIQFDSETLSVIFRVRDGLSGEVKQEYPQQSVAKGRQAVAEAAAEQTPTARNEGRIRSSMACAAYGTCMHGDVATDLAHGSGRTLIRIQATAAAAASALRV